MNVDGSNRRRISFGVGQYETPVWSPKGDLIAFTKTTADKSYIAVMRPDGQGERLLDQVSKVDSLSWAPTGRLLIFRRSSPDMGGSGRLYTVDLDGNERQIPTPSDGADPAWSPGIP
jgi:TolB protein